MSRTEFARSLEMELRMLSIPCADADLEAFVEAAWPEAQHDPDVWRWSWHYIGQVVTVELEEAVT